MLRWFMNWFIVFGICDYGKFYSVVENLTKGGYFCLFECEITSKYGQARIRSQPRVEPICEIVSLQGDGLVLLQTQCNTFIDCNIEHTDST